MKIVRTTQPRSNESLRLADDFCQQSSFAFVNGAFVLPDTMLPAELVGSIQIVGGRLLTPGASDGARAPLKLKKVEFGRTSYVISFVKKYIWSASSPFSINGDGGASDYYAEYLTFAQDAGGSNDYYNVRVGHRNSAWTVDAQYAPTAGTVLAPDHKVANLVVFPRLGQNSLIWCNGVALPMAYAGSIAGQMEEGNLPAPLIVGNGSSPAGIGAGASTYYDYLLVARLFTQAYDPVAVSINPWQLFEPERRTIFLPPAVTSTTKRWHATPLVRTTQPRGVPELDTSNPLTNGINLCVVPWINDGQLKLWDVVNKTWATPAENLSVHSINKRQGGVGALNADTGTQGGGGWITSVGGGSVCTALVVGSHGGLAQSRMPLFSGTNNVEWLGFGTDGYPTLVASGDYLVASEMWSANVPTTLAGRALAQQYALAQDGKIVSTSTFSGYSHFGSGAPTMLTRVAGMVVGFAFGAIQTDLAVGWNRHLSDAELCKATRNPWQLFKPDSRLAFFEHQAGAQYPTLSLAQVIDILQTSARPRVTITVP